MITDEQLEIALTAFNVYYDGSNPITSLREALASYEASKPTLPKAMTEAPEEGDCFWLVDIHWGIGGVCLKWKNKVPYLVWLAEGLCYATKEDAQTVAKAMLALTRGQGAEQ